jgi:hypothetical protein
VLGLGEQWEGGDVRNHAGGGHKINLFKKELLKHKDNVNKIIMFTDRYACHPVCFGSIQLQSVVQLIHCHIVCVCVCSYDVILLSGVDKILEHFVHFEARVVFSAEGFCWPDEGLASKYPSVQRGKRYLNSGGMGSVSTDIYV